MLPDPYYFDERAGITIYHCRNELILPLINPASVDLVLTDPPYGVNERTDRASRGRGGIYDWKPVAGDTEIFDPTYLIMTYKRLILWGANYYAHKLPPSKSWIIWDKRASKNGYALSPDDNADAELAWSNLGGQLRIYRHLWRGYLRDSERRASGNRDWHPTPKPVALMTWILENYSKPGDLILDPYMGAGPVLVAAKKLGRRAIGIELEQEYCDAAVTRLQQEVMALTTETKVEQVVQPSMLEI